MSAEAPTLEIVRLFESEAFKAGRRAQNEIREALRLKKKAARLRYEYERQRLSAGAARTGPREVAS